MTSDREVKGVWLDAKNAANINLKGKLLTIGEGGVNTSYKEPRPYVDTGRITSSASELVIRARTLGSSQITEYGEIVYERFALNAVIQDHKDHKVGLRIEGEHLDGEHGLVSLGGGNANTFTGDVVVSGVRNALYLAKRDGVTAIRSNVYLKEGGQLVFVNSDQITDSSTVTLSGRSSMVRFGGLKDLREKISSLVVESGQGVCDFGHPAQIRENFKRTLILDDLIIKDGAFLEIRRWKEGRDHLLVRKDSKNLADALNKITIRGWGKNQVYLKDYDKDYYSIEAAPEPTTYGAILGGLGLGAYLIRRRGLRPIFWARARWQRAPLSRT